jgi:hypothetical protein
VHIGNLSDGAAEKDVAAAVATGLASQALSNENMNNGEAIDGSASAGKRLILEVKLYRIDDCKLVMLLLIIKEDLASLVNKLYAGESCKLRLIFASLTHDV